jgi:hypothetical protein
MSGNPSFTIASPSQIAQGLFENASGNPPALPECWTATALLTPFGGLSASAPLQSSDELVVARLYYDASHGDVTFLRTRLYLLESGLFYDFGFVTSSTETSWYWIISDPADPDPNPKPIQAYGPYLTSTRVPDAQFLATAMFSYVGTWDVVNQPCDGYSAPDAHNIKGAATWFSFLSGTSTLSRVMNVDNTNDCMVPVLGAYYLANMTTFGPCAASPSIVAQLPHAKGAVTSGPSPMVTLADLQFAMANAPAGAPAVGCTPQDIAAVIPGISVPPSQPVPPAWSNQMQSACYMMGQDAYPYYCQVYYDYTVNQSQTSVFVTTDPSVSSQPYNVRQDMVLPYGTRGPSINYQWDLEAGQWQPSCFTTNGGDVPMPVPDFVAAGDGRCRAVIVNNPYFGAGDTISIWSVALAGQTGWSDFWYWFNSADQGIVFSLAPAASLTMIDYQTFIQNRPFPPGTFTEPVAGLPQCPSAATARREKVKFIPKGGYPQG